MSWGAGHSLAEPRGSANFGESQWVSVAKWVEDSGYELIDLFLRKDWEAPRMSHSISVFLVSPPVHADRPFINPKELPNQTEMHGRMMHIAQDSACLEALSSDG
jgi:hypothetical protein